MKTLEQLMVRHSAPFDDTLVTLIGHVPAEGGKFTRDELGALIRAAFQGGLVAAYTANKFSLPNGVPTQGRN